LITLLKKILLMPEQSLNKYGQCPICEYGWDGGDVLESLIALDVFKGKSQRELLTIASECYGYTEENKIRFTRLNSIDLTGKNAGKGFWECPSCRFVWNKATNEMFSTIKLALNKKSNIPF
jgi:hypothetical protein